MDHNCCHCDLSSFAYTYPLKETKNFTVVSDVHPLTEGHVLIIPKEHISCVGAYPNSLWAEFTELYKTFTKFICQTYGNFSAFEHGVIGQTVFHSHVHILPGQFTKLQIVPEGETHFSKIASLLDLKGKFERDGSYLFVDFGDSLFCVDTKLGTPRFFRDRFANALSKPERGNWKIMKANESLMQIANAENEKFARIFKTNCERLSGSS